MCKKEYIEEINAMMKKCTDTVLLDLIYKMLCRKMAHREG